MSNLANEMGRRMREDGIDPSGSGGQVPMVEVPPTQTPGAAAPGNEGGSPPPPPTPAAEPSNTDTSATGGTPETIPYARFKEVNDRYAQLRGFEELANYGYDPDSLGRLAAFEARYAADPVGTLSDLVSDLDLPQSRKDAIAELLGSPSGGSPQADGGDPDDPGNVPSSGMSEADRQAIEWARNKRESEARDEGERANQEVLDNVVNSWSALDEADKLPKEEQPTEYDKLMHIAVVASRGDFQTIEDLAKVARQNWADQVERISSGRGLGGSSRGGSPPSALPGGVAPAPALVPKTMAEANKLARAALEKGELPPMVGER